MDTIKLAFYGLCVMLPLTIVNDVNKGTMEDVTTDFETSLVNTTHRFQSKLGVETPEIRSVIFDEKTGTVRGLMSYDGLDQDGDKTRFLGIYTANVPVDAIEQFNTNFASFTQFSKKTFDLAHELTLDPVAPEFWSWAGDQADYVEKYKNILTNFVDSFSFAIDKMNNVNIQEIAKAYNFNQTLLNQELYSKPTVLSNTTGSFIGFLATGKVKTDFATNGTYLVNVSDVLQNNSGNVSRFYIDYLERSGNQTNIKQAKVTIDMSNYNQNEYSSVEEYTYSQFTSGNILEFSQNIVPEYTATVADDTLVL